MGMVYLHKPSLPMGAFWEEVVNNLRLEEVLMQILMPYESKSISMESN